MLLGDTIHAALERVGMTEERVMRWVGGPCGCKERRLKLNMLDLWARRVVGGKLSRAVEYLQGIMESDT